MAVACSVGNSLQTDPRGNFTIYGKEEDKRSGSYGFRVQGDRVVPAKPVPTFRTLCWLPDGILVRFAPAMDFIRLRAIQPADARLYSPEG